MSLPNYNYTHHLSNNSYTLTKLSSGFPNSKTKLSSSYTNTLKRIFSSNIIITMHMRLLSCVHLFSQISSSDIIYASNMITQIKISVEVRLQNRIFTSSVKRIIIVTCDLVYCSSSCCYLRCNKYSSCDKSYVNKMKSSPLAEFDTQFMPAEIDIFPLSTMFFSMILKRELIISCITKSKGKSWSIHFMSISSIIKANIISQSMLSEFSASEFRIVQTTSVVMQSKRFFLCNTILNINVL